MFDVFAAAPRPARSGPRWWAVFDRGVGYIIDVYPDEAACYRRNLSRALGSRAARLLGEFATPQEARARAAQAVRDGPGAYDRAVLARALTLAGGNRAGAVILPGDAG